LNGQITKGQDVLLISFQIDWQWSSMLKFESEL